MVLKKKILTPREHEVFMLLALRYSTQEIAIRLGISPKTTRNHISNVIQKLDVKNRVQALKELIKLGEINDFIVD